jgi:hypothetical protein
VAIQNFFTSRDNNLDGNTYVGQLGRLWFNPDTNSIYASDGVTVGGVPVDLATGANAAFDGITVNTIASDDSTAVSFISEANFYEPVFVDSNMVVSGNISVTGNISPAAAGKIGGIQPGPGVDISNTGLLTIDSANLSFSFGNFTANNNILTIVNSDEDMILATQGSAEIQLVGNIGFYKPNGLPPDPNNLFFFARDDGQITILVPATDPLQGAVEIIGSASGNSVPPAVAGVMLHITGNNDEFSTIYNDGVNNFPNYIGRRYNGLASAPTQVLAGNTIVRFSGQGYPTGGFTAGASGSLSLDALEDFTATNQGTIWRFLNNAVGGNTRQQVANISVANGVVATQFETSGNITATGNISGGNLILSSGGIISSTGLISTTGNISAGNVNSYVTLPAGTANIAPLVFTTGVITTAPIAGGMNYDGRVFYATPQSNERGLIVTEQLYVVNADYNIVDQTALQSLLGVSATLSSATRYSYRITATVYKTANNIALQYALGGTVTLARHTYETLTTAAAALGTLTSPSVVRNVLTTNFGTAVTVTANLNGAGYYSLTVQGILNVTTGGTWFPQIGFTGLPGAGSLVTGGSKIEIWPIGATGANVSIGNWT